MAQSKAASSSVALSMASGTKRGAASRRKPQAAVRATVNFSTPDSRWWRAQIQTAARVA